MKKPWLALLALLPVLVLGFSRLRLETDILATLPGEVPEVRALKLLRDGFSGGNDLIIALEAEDEAVSEELTAAIAEVLGKRTDLVKEVRWGQPMESQARSGAALLAWSLENADPRKLQELRGALEGNAVKARLQSSLQAVSTSLDAEKIQRSSYDPLGLLDSLDTSAAGALEGSLFGLVSEDGAFRVLMVTPAGSVGNYKAAGAWLTEVKTLINHTVTEHRKDLGMPRLRYTGEPAFQAEIGAGIEKDMSSTIGMTEVLITLLFWVMFRRLRPLLWIQGLVMLSMVITLGLGGLLVGKLSIMSLGFAAIVLGIIVDYAVLIIQEARQHPALQPGDLRKIAAPGIAAGACTTAVVFLSLLFSGLPGMAEMGLLVALGVIVGFVVMVFFAPRLAAGRQAGQAVSTAPAWHSHAGLARLGTALLLLASTAVLATRGLPAFHTGAEALRPTQSEAMDTFEWVQQRLGRDHECSVPILVTGPAKELKARSEALRRTLDAARESGAILRHALPTMLVGAPGARLANRAFIDWLQKEQPRLEKEIDAAGFTEAAMGLLRGICEVWKSGGSEAAAASILNRMIATGIRAETAGMKPGDGVVLASVSVAGKPGLPDREKLAGLQKLLTPETGAWLAGWETLGGALSTLVRQDLEQQMLPIIGLIVLTLFVTFRRWQDLVLSVLLLSVGMTALAATMSLLGVGWNLASLAAIPLLLGTGIDYGIHVLLSLQRCDNDVRLVQATTGRAVFFSGMTTVIGFSSLFFAGNRGISSLGLACCLGTVWILIIVLWLLPHWRRWLMACSTRRKQP